ncbi:MAG: glutamine-hydrolyzing carbamoyl-phosphate synthase small subunit [Bacteroidetes bacterium]|jgi:carbamoyl-phosphate synthase small subunit|nr:glutamine-hydrolyzing carbamoyl-phosphate synthase small subunit [Bacteroidota bacterium]
MVKTRESKVPAVLLLADGKRFEGHAAGAVGITTGEIAFNTGMYGYQEIFTDPSYHQQILIMATAHIGNYGVHDREVESDKVQIAGLVTKNYSSIASRAGASGTLQDYLDRDQVVGICDLDTRALVRHIRQSGAMNAIICSDGTDEAELMKRLQEVPSMEGLELSSAVSTKQVYDAMPEEGVEPRHRVALLDLGVKRSIVQCLTDRGCAVRVFPMQSTAEEILAWSPDGIMLSNGPGDPGAMSDTVETVKALVNSDKPIFGICLGHQVLALSQGLRTQKMFNGHRGVNHPIKNLITGKAEITSQNHGFVVDKDSLHSVPTMEVTHIHLNDESIAGIALKGRPVFSVQYHPEASAGPHDSRYLFDQFVENMEQVAVLD